MIKKITQLILVSSTLPVLLGGCVSQGSYDAIAQEHNQLVQENNQLVEKNSALQQELQHALEQKDAVTKDLAAAKERIYATNRVMIESFDKMVDARAKVMTTQELYNNLVNKLSSEMQSQQLTIDQMQSGVRVNLPEAVLFDSGSAQVKATGKTVLIKVAKELADVPFQTIVGGFTDNVPISPRLLERFPSNWDLAAARATSVVRLMESSGVPKARMIAVSLGENQPIVSNDTVEGRAQNRRIEIRLRPVVIGQ